MSMIALSLIAPPSWNSRLAKSGKLGALEKEKIGALAESFKSHGQQTAIEVEGPTDGKYILVFGSRRLAAAHVAGWEAIEANVRPLSNEIERMSRNIRENMERENLTSFEEARVWSALKEQGHKLADIAGITGTGANKASVAKISNLTVAYDRLPDAIKKDWEAQHPAATQDFLRELANDKVFPTAEGKVKAWDERCRALAAKPARGEAAPDVEGEGEGEGEGKSTDSGTGGFPVSQKRLGHVIDMLSSKKKTPDLDDDLRAWSRALINYIVKGRDTLPEGIPPLEEKVKAAPLDGGTNRRTKGDKGGGKGGREG